jgi:hypothetical protein
MPLAEAGFQTPDGRSDSNSLILFGPTIPAYIGHHPSTDLISPATEQVSALVDSGAEQSCIDKSIAEKLGLPVVDVQMVAGANGAQEQPVYMANLQFPPLNFTEYGRFIGVDLMTGGQPHGALLGRSFLRHVIMIYDGIRGQVTIASPLIPG